MLNFVDPGIFQTHQNDSHFWGNASALQFDVKNTVLVTILKAT